MSAGSGFIVITENGIVFKQGQSSIVSTLKLPGAPPPTERSIIIDPSELFFDEKIIASVLRLTD